MNSSTRENKKIILIGVSYALLDVCAKEYVEITKESELLELYGKHRKEKILFIEPMT